MKLFEILRKNFKLLLRSKTSALIVLLGPLVLMLLVSMSFNTNSLFDIKIGSYSSSYSELSDSILTQLEDDAFKVIKLDSEEACMNSIKSGDLHVCAIFPAELNIQSEDNVLFYVDKSRVNLVWIVLDSVSDKISTKSSELSTALTNTLLGTLDSTQQKLEGKTDKIVEIKTSLTSTETVVNDLSDKLDNLNLSFDDNVSDLEERASDLNLTGDPGDLIDDYQDLVEEFDDKIGDISTIKNAAVSDLSRIKSGLDSGSSELDSLSSTIIEIKDNIDAIEVKDVRKIVSPVSTEIKPIVGEKTHLSNVFPTMMIVVLLFSGIFLGMTYIVQERVSKAYFRNFISPTHGSLFIFGNYLSSLIIVLFQVIIIFVVIAFLGSDKLIIENIFTNVAVVILVLASVFILLGMLLGYIFKSGETANLGAVALACILLFFSNTILPLETLPAAIKAIASYNPFVMGELVLKETLLFDQCLAALGTGFYILIGYVLGLLILVYILREFT
ncbi:ABC transporter permease, partial [archaeon]|nr:ABC transporter permease [archaeon]